MFSLLKVLEFEKVYLRRASVATRGEYLNEESRMRKPLEEADIKSIL
jgi:hypothetical protein